MEPGEIIRVVSAGGGGWGNPFKREARLVSRDVEFGYVTTSSARKDYGVVLKKGFEVDEKATAKLRIRLKQKKRRSRV